MEWWLIVELDVRWCLCVVCVESVNRCLLWRAPLLSARFPPTLQCDCRLRP